MKLEKEVWLQNLTWEDVKQKTTESQGTIILPIGSTEQHGPHLPVGTDTMVANSIAEAAALKAGIHLVLPGTITIRAEVLIEIAFDMIKSLSSHKFDKFILLNGHRIVNVAWMQIAAERAKRELGIKVVIFDPAYMSKEFTGDMDWGEVGHAEEIEGSHMWYCYPDLVKMESRARICGTVTRIW
jgi:creatinine amidohydrolase